MKKTGLGRGLDALFANIPEEEEKIDFTANDILQNLKLTEVEPNREQARKTFDQEALEELADSIKKYGVIQPIIVTKKDGYYGIVAGERRWRASKIAGLTEIPAIIREDDERKNKEVSLIENIQREDLNIYEKAMGIKTLMETYNLTQEEIANTLGKARCTISNIVRILNLNPDVLEFAKQGKLTEAHCRALVSIPDPKKQYDMALRIIEKGESSTITEKKVHLAKKSPGTDEKYTALFRNIEDSFQGFFGTKVKVDAGRRKGKIIIEYNNNDDLERILGLIK